MTFSLRRTGLDPSQTLWTHSPADFGLVEVAGPDAGEFLHRLSSQDVAGMRSGNLRPAAFLNPKGKLLASGWIARLPDRFVIEVASRQVADLAELLERYHFSEKLAISVRKDSHCAELVGDAGPAVAGVPLGTALVDSHGNVLLSTSWRELVWVRAHSTATAALPWASSHAAALTDSKAELLRIASGIPLAGVDTDASTLGPEAGIEPAFSLTKGCYTGQEIVARIATYGHVNRKLCLVEIAAAAAPAPGTPLCELEDGDPVGRTTSSAMLPTGDRCLALAYLPRDFWAEGTQLALAAKSGSRVQVLDFGAAVASTT